MIFSLVGKARASIGCYPYGKLNGFSCSNVENKWTAHSGAARIGKCVVDILTLSELCVESGFIELKQMAGQSKNYKLLLRMHIKCFLI